MSPTDSAEEVLPDDVIAKLQQAYTRLVALQTRTARAAECGFDCRAEEAYRAALADRIKRVLDAYGPQRQRR